MSWEFLRVSAEAFRILTSRGVVAFKPCYFEMRLVVLDRDGVINQDSDKYIRTADEWMPIPGSLEAIGKLTNAGYRIIVASNQSGLGRGYFDIDALNAMHRKMRRELSKYGGLIEAVFFCPHRPEVGCHCRKPLPGLLLDIAERLRINMKGVPVVGDSFRDIRAGLAVGASPILVLTGKGLQTAKDNADKLTGIPSYKDLAAATDAMLSI